MQINKIVITLYAVLLPLWVAAQSVSVVRENKQQKFHKSMPAGNYSGIAWLSGNRYAVVDDKSAAFGYHLFLIDIDSITGKIVGVEHEGWRNMPSSAAEHDIEGVAYVPAKDSVYLMDEAVGGNESLTYNPATRRFWTTKEHASPHHLVCYDEKMNQLGMWVYRMDAPVKRGSVHGISELCALDDGCLLVMEREFKVAKLKIGTRCMCKLYLVNPKNVQAGSLLQKTLLAELNSRLTITGRKLANWEGMCLGPRLADGNRVLVLIADSQYRYKGVMKDWLKTLVIEGK